MPIRILCAPDKFKQACSADEAARAMADGVRRAAPGADIRVLPLADGGEGTLEVLREVFPQRKQVPTCDARGRKVTAAIAFSDDGTRALVESAQACGLWRLDEGERNPLETETRGVGQLIAAALDAGAREIMLGLGGSATCDGGAGMLHALGAKFYSDAEIVPTGGTLKDLRRVDLSGIDKRLQSVQLIALCDVTSPMIGPNSATRRYTVQKGGSTRMIHKLEQNLDRLVKCAAKAGVLATGLEPGSGAAGGLGYGAMLLGGQLQAGAATVLELIGFEKQMAGVDLVLTGEGSYDEQTAEGKLVAALGQACGKARVPLVVLAGAARPVNVEGVTAAFSVNIPGARKQDNLNATLESLRRHAAAVVRLMNR
jgi:glycerate kinase